MSVEQVIKTGVNEFDVPGVKVYLSPEIDEKKLNNAVSAISPGIDPSVVVAIIDISLFGNAKDGIVFTGDSLYHKGLLGKSVAVPFEAFKKIVPQTIETKDDKGKVTITRTVDLFDAEGNSLLLIKNPPFDHEKFSVFLEAIIGEGGEEAVFQTSKQAQQLKDMEMSIRISYIKVVCNYLHHETETINNKEYAEIISLIVRNEIDNESRFALRQYIMNKEELEDANKLIDFLNTNVDEGSRATLNLGLIQDVVKMFRIREANKPDCNYSNWSKDTYLTSIQNKLSATNEQIVFLLDKLQKDEDIIAKRQDDNQIKNTLADLASKAPLIGIPVAALYLSGSVWVFSGVVVFGSALSVLGPLAFGVAIGYGAYKGIKHLTGISEIEGNGKRELMLQGIIRNSQKSLNFLIEDVNYIAKKLVDELSKGQAAGILIQKLQGNLMMLTSSSETMSTRVNDAEREAVIAKLPQKLNKMRFEELTNNPTEQKLRPIVFDVYKETTIKDDNGKESIEYVLNYDLSLSELDEIFGILDSIGYLNIKDAGIASAKAIAKDFFGKAKEALSKKDDDADNS